MCNSGQTLWSFEFTTLIDALFTPFFSLVKPIIPQERVLATGNKVIQTNAQLLKANQLVVTHLLKNQHYFRTFK